MRMAFKFSCEVMGLVLLKVNDAVNTRVRFIVRKYSLKTKVVNEEIVRVGEGKVHLSSKPLLTGNTSSIQDHKDV